MKNKTGYTSYCENDEYNNSNNSTVYLLAH